MRIVEILLQFVLRLAELVFIAGLKLLVAVLTAAGKALAGGIGHAAKSHQA